jgi:hypothetical protein
MPTSTVATLTTHDNINFFFQFTIRGYITGTCFDLFISCHYMYIHTYLTNNYYKYISDIYIVVTVVCEIVEVSVE